MNNNSKVDILSHRSGLTGYTIEKLHRFLKNPINMKLGGLYSKQKTIRGPKLFLVKIGAIGHSSQNDCASSTLKVYPPKAHACG